MTVPDNSVRYSLGWVGFSLSADWLGVCGEMRSYLFFLSLSSKPGLVNTPNKESPSELLQHTFWVRAEPWAKSFSARSVDWARMLVHLE